MSKELRLTGVEPNYAIPGGEVIITCEGFRISEAGVDGVFIGGVRCRVVAASSTRILAIAPSGVSGAASVQLVSGGAESNLIELQIGRLLHDGMHIVANPAVDPADDAIILTRSGARGQSLPATLFRLEKDGFLDELPEPVLNPTGIAFDANGEMFVSNRSQGEIYTVRTDGTATVYATGLGIATGLAFDAKGSLYVGDRSGTIYRINAPGELETFTVMEASVAAYHMAFGPDGRLFMTSPGLASYDAVHAIDAEGFDEYYFRGLGRPQGLAFDDAGRLYVAACYRGRHGIVRIEPGGDSAGTFVAGNNIVGLCFTRDGEMVVATDDSVYSIDCGVRGTLLPN